MSEKKVTSESKEWKKAVKLLGEKEVMELAAKPDQELLDLISLNAVEVKRVTDLTLENPAFQKAQLVVKDFKSGLKETLKSSVTTSSVAARILKDRADGGDVE